MKIAFLFPGQGSQYVGMGSQLYNTCKIAKQTYEEASDVLGWDIAKICFEGPEDTLNQTEYTQPAILTTSIAAWRSLGVAAQVGLCVAGHSLGEYTALVVAEAVSFSDAVQIVFQRGRFMQDAGATGHLPTGECGATEHVVFGNTKDIDTSTATNGSRGLGVPVGTPRGEMAAIVGLDRVTVQAICETASTPEEPVTPANFNAPDQIVIAGRSPGLERAIALAEKAGAKRVVRLAVSVPSHSPLMRPACHRLSEVLDKIDGKDLAIPLVNNLEAKVVTCWAEAKAALVDQLAHPLLWDQSIQTMRNLGADFFIEIGPGRVLSGILKRIDRTLKGTYAERPDEIEAVRKIIQGGG